MTVPHKAQFTWLILAALIAISPQKSFADCNSPEAQEILRWLEAEGKDVYNFKTLGRCGTTMIVFYNGLIAETERRQRNQARQRGASANGTKAYQLQYRQNGAYFAGPTFLRQWDCIDARWSSRNHGARCVEVTISPVN